MRRSARVERGVGCVWRVQPSPYRSLERPVTARRKVVEEGEQRLLKAAGSVKHLLVEVSGPSAPWSGGAPVDPDLVRWSLRNTHHADLLEVSNQIPAAGRRRGCDMDQESRRLSPGHAADEDPVPEVFPEQDPKVDREWEEAKNDPMGGESPSS